MSSCDESNIKKKYIVQSAADFDVLSACTAFYTNNIYNCAGGTLTLHSDIVSANTINASVYLSGGTNLLDIFGSLDNYTTGATLVGTEVVFDRTNLLSAYTLNLSTLVDNNTFVTGYTYDDANTFTISDNSGSTFNATFNTVTGLTVTGGLSATTISACTGIYTSNLYGCSPITTHDKLILLSGLTFSSITQDNSLIQILSRDSSDGTIKYRDVQSIISAATSQDTFVTGGTYNEGTTSIDFSGNSVETTFTVDLSTMGATFGNTYFVTPEGDDLTGQRGNITLPFQTITGARDKAVGEISASTVTGTTLVYVFPGDYVGDELQYDNGNFYFEPGAVVTSIPRDSSVSPGTTSMFVVGGVPKYISSSYSANTCNVFGSGEFFLPESIDNDWNGSIISVSSSGSGYFECYKFNVEQGVGIGVFDNGRATFVGKFLTVDSGYVATVRDYGDAVFNFNRISCDNGIPFFIRYGSSGGFYGKCVVNSEEISAGALGGSQAVVMQRLRDGAEVIINSDKFTSAASYAIYAAQCTGGDVTINGKLFGVRGVLSQASSGGNFYINADIEATEGGIDMLSNTDNHTVIYDGNINILSGATDGIDLDGGTLKLHGSLTNKDISGTGTTYNGIDKSGGILEIDSFSVFTDNESIVGSGNVTINRSLYVDKPINGSIITSGQYIFTGTTNVGDLVIYNTPTNNNLATDILVRNNGTGDVEYRDVSSIIGAASADTFVTGFTYDNINTFTISDNSGSTFNTSINVLSATTISATTYFGDGSNLSGIDNFYVSGGSYNDGSKNINFSGNSVDTTFDVDLTSLISSVSGDTFVVSGNANAGTSELTFSYNTGGTFTVTNSAALFSDNDINVTGGTYNPSNGCVTFGTNSGTTFDVCGFVTGITDTYTTGSTLSLIHI
jgi:hypothetical protein